MRVAGQAAKVAPLQALEREERSLVVAARLRVALLERASDRVPADLEAAKQDAAAARKETAELRTSLRNVEKWAGDFGKTYLQDRNNLDSRVKRLEGLPAPPPAAK